MFRTQHYVADDDGRKSEDNIIVLQLICFVVHIQLDTSFYAGNQKKTIQPDCVIAVRDIF